MTTNKPNERELAPPTLEERLNDLIDYARDINSLSDDPSHAEQKEMMALLCKKTILKEYTRPTSTPSESETTSKSYERFETPEGTYIRRKRVPEPTGGEELVCTSCEQTYNVPAGTTECPVCFSSPSESCQEIITQSDGDNHPLDAEPTGGQETGKHDTASDTTASDTPRESCPDVDDYECCVHCDGTGLLAGVLDEPCDNCGSTGRVEKSISPNPSDDIANLLTAMIEYSDKGQKHNMRLVGDKIKSLFQTERKRIKELEHKVDDDNRTHSADPDIWTLADWKAEYQEALRMDAQALKSYGEELDKNTQLEKELADVRTKFLVDLSGDPNTYDLEVGEYKERINQLTKKLAEAKEELGKIKRQKDNWEAKSTRLLDEKQGLVKKYTKQQKELATERENVSHWKGEYARVNTMCDDLFKRCDDETYKYIKEKYIDPPTDQEETNSKEGEGTITCTELWLEAKRDRDYWRTSSKRVYKELADVKEELEGFKKRYLLANEGYLEQHSKCEQWKIDYEMACDDCTKAEKELATEREKHRWIPVSERLPEDVGFYLACRTLPNSDNQEIFIGRWLYKHWGYMNFTTRITEQVTHWQPLPAPPTDQEEQEGEG